MYILPANEQRVASSLVGKAVYLDIIAGQIGLPYLGHVDA
jgi:hypothetical protein